MTTQTDDLVIPTIKDFTPAAAAASIGIELPPASVLPASKIAASTGLDQETVEKARDAMSEVEFNAFVDTLEGDDSVNTDTLRDLARKLNKKTFKGMAESTRIAKEAAAQVAALTQELAAIRQAEAEKAKTAEKAQTEDANAVQFQKLSTACGVTGVDLEAALGDAKIKALLTSGIRDSKTPFTYLQEVTAFIANGSYESAATVMKEVVEKARGDVKVVTVSPEASTTPAVEPKTVSYEEELMTQSRMYATSNKTFAETKANQEAIAALKLKHGRG